MPDADKAPDLEKAKAPISEVHAVLKDAHLKCNEGKWVLVANPNGDKDECKYP
jgi:hypothetical protein